MKAVILSGGKGSRVRPLTYDLPKPMIPLLERPIISYLFHLLKEHNFEDVIVTVSYKAEILEDHYQNGVEHGLQIAYSLEGSMRDGHIVPEALGSAGGLKKVNRFSNFFDEPFLVICGDALIDLDLTSAMKYHKSHNGIATVVCKKVAKEEVYKYGVVVADKKNRILSFQEKPNIKEAKSDIINTGIYIFDPEILDYIPNNQAFDIGGELLPLLVKKDEPFYAFSPDFQWVDVGTTADFHKATEKLLFNQVAYTKPYGKEIKPNVWIGINCDINFDEVEIIPPVYIGNSVRLEKGVKIVGPSMIGSGSLIKKDVVLEKTILFNYTQINEKLRFKHKIITTKYVVDTYGGYVDYIDIEKTNLHFLVEDSRAQKRKLNINEKALLNVIQEVHSIE